jgi:DNA-binding SARP family transcriptional activator
MTRQPVKSFAAAIALAAIVAGVPVLLYRLGGGLPTGLPSGHQAATFLGQPIADHAVLRGLSLACWALWALFLLAICTEATAWARHRPGPSHTGRGFRIPGLQGAAGSLFLTAVLLLPLRTPQPGPDFAATAVATPVALSSGPIPSQAASAQPAKPAVVPANRVPYIVTDGETLWGIAEAHTGNGLAWRQITDIDGRTFDTGTDAWVQINGHSIYERDSRLIFPGETVLLPAAWTLPKTTAFTSPPTTPSVAPTTPPTEQPAPPSSDPTPAPTAAAPATPADPPTTASPQRSDLVKADNIDTAEVVELLGAGMVAGAALSTLTRLRSRQSRYRQSGRRIRLPGPDLAATEVQLRRAQRPDLTTATHQALHALAGELRARNRPIPLINAVITRPDQLELLLDQPATPPPSWETDSDGYRWTIATNSIPADRCTGADPLPCLLPLGHLSGSEAEVMINLAAAGILNLRGDTNRAEATVLTAGITLTGLPWAASANVIAVGHLPPVSEAAEHVRVVPTLDSVIDELERQIIDLRQDLVNQPDQRIDQLDGFLPTLVLLIQPDHDDAYDRLTTLCATAGGLYAVIAGPRPADRDPLGWEIDLDTDPSVIPQLQIAVEINPPSPQWADHLQKLIAVATDTADVSIDHHPYNHLQSSHTVRVDGCLEPTESANDHSESPPEVARINVLGPVTFRNVDNFLRPRSFEIALYLSLHPDGISESRLDETIWPTKTEVPKSTRDQAISAARTALGGRTRLPLAQGQGADKTYRLSNQVTTDWDEFCTLHRQGRQSNEVEPLHQALQLVRGRPFGDLDSGPGFKWLHTEGHLYHMEAEVADTADLAAGHYLDQDQPVKARWAATQGLLVGPYTERLWIRLMAAADALGEAQEIERLLTEMDTRLGLDGDYSQLHPDTIAAYRSYSRQRVSRKQTSGPRV